MAILISHIVVSLWRIRLENYICFLKIHFQNYIVESIETILEKLRTYENLKTFVCFLILYMKGQHFVVVLKQTAQKKIIV